MIRKFRTSAGYFTTCFIYVYIDSIYKEKHDYIQSKRLMPFSPKFTRSWLVKLLRRIRSVIKQTICLWKDLEYNDKFIILLQSTMTESFAPSTSTDQEELKPHFYYAQYSQPSTTQSLNSIRQSVSISPSRQSSPQSQERSRFFIWDKVCLRNLIKMVYFTRTFSRISLLIIRGDTLNEYYPHQYKPQEEYSLLDFNHHYKDNYLRQPANLGLKPLAELKKEDICLDDYRQVTISCLAELLEAVLFETSSFCLMRSSESLFISAVASIYKETCVTVKYISKHIILLKRGKDNQIKYDSVLESCFQQSKKTSLIITVINSLNCRLLITRQILTRKTRAKFVEFEEKLRRLTEVGIKSEARVAWARKEQQNKEVQLFIRLQSVSHLEYFVKSLCKFQLQSSLHRNTQNSDDRDLESAYSQQVNDKYTNDWLTLVYLIQNQIYGQGGYPNAFRRQWQVTSADYMQNIETKITPELNNLEKCPYFKHNQPIFLSQNNLSINTRVFESTELFSCASHMIQREVVAMLNSGGGVILFDCQSIQGVIVPKGDRIKEVQKRIVETVMSEIVKKIQPIVCKQIMVSFVPVIKPNSPNDQQLELVRINILPQHPQMLYRIFQSQSGLEKCFLIQRKQAVELRATNRARMVKKKVRSYYWGKQSDSEGSQMLLRPRNYADGGYSRL